MVEEITNEALESLQTEGLIPPPGERLLKAVSANQRDYPSFGEVLAQMRAQQTPAQKSDLSMDSEVGYVEGLALRATFHNFGDAAEGRAAYARDPDQGYRIPHPRNLTSEARKVAVEPDVVPVEAVAAQAETPRTGGEHAHHIRHKSPHAEVVEHIPYYGGDHSPRLSRCGASI